jgi:hypothetical protein
VPILFFQTRCSDRSDRSDAIKFSHHLEVPDSWQKCLTVGRISDASWHKYSYKLPYDGASVAQHSGYFTDLTLFLKMTFVC